MKKLLNRSLRILLATNGLIIIAGAALAPIYALFVEKIGGDLLDASFAGAAYAFAGGVTTLISGKLADKVKQNEFIVVFGYAVMGAGFLSYIWISSIAGLLVAQIIIGFGEAVYSPAFDAIYSKHLAKTKRGFGWGSWESMNYFVSTIGAILGGLVVSNYGFIALFVIMAVISFCSAIYIFFLPRESL